MSRMDVERMAENYALATFLTDWDELNYDEIMESFSMNVVPDGVIIWQPFEGFSCDSLMYFIQNTRDDYLNFADRLTGGWKDA